MKRVSTRYRLKENGNDREEVNEERNRFEVVRKRDKELWAVMLEVMIDDLGGLRAETGYSYTLS